jgi:hypothetical protein
MGYHLNIGLALLAKWTLSIAERAYCRHRTEESSLQEENVLQSPLMMPSPVLPKMPFLNSLGIRFTQRYSFRLAGLGELRVG